MKYLKNERGVTLIELLAAVALTSVIGIVAYGVMFNGFKAYDKITVETKLRDEADLIMAEFLGVLFPLKASEIESTHFPADNTNNYYIELEDGSKIGIYDGDIYVKNPSAMSLQTDEVRLTPESSITEITEGHYRIRLVLEWIDSGQTLSSESEVRIIRGA